MHILLRIIRYSAYFFVTLLLKTAKLLHFGKKKNEFFCFALNFS